MCQIHAKYALIYEIVPPELELHVGTIMCMHAIGDWWFSYLLVFTQHKPFCVSVKYQ